MGTDEWASKEIMRQCLLVSMMGEEIPQYSIFFLSFFFPLFFIFLRKRGREMMEKGSFQRIEK